MRRACRVDAQVAIFSLSLRPGLACAPRVDQGDPGVGEVLGVSGGKRAIVGGGDAGDLEVSPLDADPLRPKPGVEFGCGGGGGVIEVENPTRQGFTEYPIESFVEEVPPLAGGQDIDSESDLEHADAGGPDRCGGLSVKPSQDHEVGFGPHEGGDHVAV